MLARFLLRWIVGRELKAVLRWLKNNFELYSFEQLDAELEQSRGWLKVLGGDMNTPQLPFEEIPVQQWEMVLRMRTLTSVQEKVRRLQDIYNNIERYIFVKRRGMKDGREEV
jgi:hypothetical protein